LFKPFNKNSMENISTISSESLRQLLASGETVNIIDIRPLNERAEWYIPGSIHMDISEKLKQKNPSVFKDVHFDKSVPIVTVCAGGKTSVVAADMLQQKGYKTYSLQEGMKGWSLAWNTAYKQFDDFELWQVRRTGKGCLSYIIASKGEAIIVDASLPLEVYLKLVQQNQLSVKYVIETHIHADHLSRSREISQYFEAPLYIPFPSKVQFEFKKITSDTTFSIGSIEMKSIATPGHTFDSFSYYIEKHVLLTGDTLFTNAVGRPDLNASAEESRRKTKMLYQSLRKLISFPDKVMVLPAHTNKPVAFDNEIIKATIGEAKKNISFLHRNEDEFIDSLLDNLPPAPSNYLSIIEKNIKGNFSDANPVDLEAGANHCAIS